MKVNFIASKENFNSKIEHVIFYERKNFAVLQCVYNILQIFIQIYKFYGDDNFMTIILFLTQGQQKYHDCP